MAGAGTERLAQLVYHACLDHASQHSMQTPRPNVLARMRALSLEQARQLERTFPDPAAPKAIRAATRWILGQMQNDLGRPTSSPQLPQIRSPTQCTSPSLVGLEPGACAPAAPSPLRHAPRPVFSRTARPRPPARGPPLRPA